jgi:protein dithiol oxidoreductase (disulfide-forming)
MRFLRFALVAASLVAGTAFASPTAPVQGVEYTTLASPQPVAPVGKKVEVIEFFMYHCPHCNVLEPYLAEWIKKQGDNIVVKRVHFPYYGPMDPEAHLFLTLEAMGKLEEMHAKVFKAIHTDRVRMNKDDIVIDWVSKNGIAKDKFLEYWNSFGVLTKLKRLSSITAAYKVDSAPSLVIEGKYVTSPAVVGAANPKVNEGELSKLTMQVLDGLVAKVQAEKGIKPVAGK